ncbi:G-protein coupled receptor GRL101-like [Asterias rubens]|uniref:G-protein coupled receptor GRL101-like n=1 Tax=Asterias rubens TaxID=7604 RepID=UPI001455320A|nr:G-protein coupled receptor GRL101-like [Asterias rubens]
MSFTQREKPGICDSGTTLCSYSSVCLPAVASCDTFIDCGDFSDQLDCKMCGDTNITLVPNTPVVLKYGVPGYLPEYPSHSIWHPPKMDCFWIVSAPDNTVIEINILAMNFIGPDIHIGSAVDGANDESERLFEIRKPIRDPGIMYTPVTSIWIHSDIISAKFDRGNVFELKLTAYEEKECDPGEFQCYNQKCLPGSALCDGIPDCFVKEDEYGCDSDCSYINYYMCPDGEHCIPSDYICDGFSRCDGMEDEFGCGRCGDSYINLSPGQPVEVHQPVDITVECLWLVSTSTRNQSSRIRIDIQDLPIREFDHYQSGRQIAELNFGSGRVVSKYSRLRSLEESVSHPTLLTFDGPDLWITLEMKANNFVTGGRPHVKFTVQEYTIKNCEDDDDFSCSSGLLCVSGDKVCDGTSDCPESEDEVGCDLCFEHEFRCSSDELCVNTSFICNGVYDCTDRSDERFCGAWGDNFIDLSSGQRRLTSIGYGDPFWEYPVNTYREWLIRASPGNKVIVEFLDFETEYYYDFLSLRSVSPLPLILNVTGEQNPTRISLHSQEITLFFLSDFTDVKRGFDLILHQNESVSCGEGETECNRTDALICILTSQVCDNRGNCPGATDEEFCSDICGQTFIQLITDQPHTLYSPLYHHGTYPFKTSCLWVVTTIRKQNIILAVKDFHLEQSYDDLRIGVGNDSNYGLVKRLTGTTKISSIVFRSNTIWMEMSTDDSVSDIGFELVLSSVAKMNGSDCHGTESHLFSCPHRHDTTLCLHDNAYCDGFIDCGDKSDEIKCENLTCGDLYLCKGKYKCLLWESVCDGTPDCERFRDDETNCDVRGCPPDCNCSFVNNDLHVTCQNGWSPSMIGQLVKRTSALDLGGGNVTVLTGGMFKRLVLLRTLSLRNNGIIRMELNAFEGLNDLTSLDISENNIGELLGGVFNGLTMLTELGIRHVPIRHIRSGAFKGLSRLERLVLMRSDGTQNPTNYDEPAAKIETGALADLKSLQVVYVDDHRLCCDFESVLNHSNNCVNIQLQSPLFNCGRLMRNLILQIFMWILGFSALIGNAVVIAWRIREDSGKGSKYVHSFLVLNLAMSDFLMGVYMIIIASVDAIKKEQYYLEATQWRNSALCKAAGVISVLSSEASVFFITLISLDRYMCIVHPFSRIRLRETSVWLSALGIWSCTLILSLMPTIYSTSDSHIYGLSDVCIGLPLLTRPESYTFKQGGFVDALSNNTYLIPVPQGSKPSWSYSIVLFLGVNLLCFLAVTLCYVAIFAKVKRSVRRVKRSHKENEIKLASKMAIIVGSDFLCWMPVIVLGILSQTSVIKIEPDVYAWLVVFVLPINSSLNPYLYTIVTVVSRRNQAVQSTVKVPKKMKTDPAQKVPGNPAEDDQACWTTASSRSMNMQNLTNKI